MPDSEFVRVKYANGAQGNLPAGHPAIKAEGVTVLDKPTHYDNGDPVPPKTVPAGLLMPDRTGLTIAELRSEIDQRNTTRDESQQISTSGNKAALVDALAADDVESAELAADDAEGDVNGGPSADTEKED